MSPGPKYLFAAVHKGPYLSIRPLERELGPEKVVYLVEGVSRGERTQEGLPYLDIDRIEGTWGSIEGYLSDAGIKAVVRSSSEDVAERNVEELASRGATIAGIPVFVIEDFPGNFWPRDGERVDRLFVEDDSISELHRSRGLDGRLVYSTGNPRYNELSLVHRDERRLDTRSVFGLEDELVVLWAGQPDGDNSYLALLRLLKHFTGHQVTLLFRAHPRDASYMAGSYAPLLAGSSMKVVDTSTYPDAVGLYCASDLVVTQFSSAGVEASYLGVPALFALFDDLGKEYLRSFKGYDELPWCKGECAFVIESEGEIRDVMEHAVFDSAARETVCENFRRRFGSREDSANVIGRHVREMVAGAA